MPVNFKTELINPANLTPREAQVLCCLCSALSDKQISRALAISIRTVQHHIEVVQQKLDVSQQSLNKRVGTLRQALLRGMIRY